MYLLSQAACEDDNSELHAVVSCSGMTVVLSVRSCKAFKQGYTCSAGIATTAIRYPGGSEGSKGGAKDNPQESL